MANWKRITLVVFVLIGGTMAFGYWFRYQFTLTLNNLETIITANTLLVSPSLKKDANLASTSLETFGVLATSSGETISEVTTSTIPVTASSSDLEPSFNFPKKEVYIGCTYPISWQPSATINSLGTVLVDAGARKVIDPIVSGLAKESIIETDSKNLNWKVGVTVWPGKYYIKVFKINSSDVEIRSKVFIINTMPKGISTDEREKICKKSGVSI